MHEHHAVHELDFVFAAGVEHRPHFSTIDAARLLAQHVLAGLGGADHPLLANAGRQRDVDGIDVLAGEQFFVAAAGLGLSLERDV